MHVMQHRPILTTVDVCLKHPAELGHDEKKIILNVIVGL